MRGMTFFHFYEKVYGLLHGKKPKRKLFNFEVHLNDHCNLNCKSCFHFAPLAKSGSFYPLDEFERDIHQLSATFEGKFGWVHLMGGEPLLNKDINRYLEIVGKAVKVGDVSLLTNGILLFKMDGSFFDTCKKYNIAIAVTKYPIGLDYGKMRDFVEAHGCRFLFFDEHCEQGFSYPSLRKEGKFSAKRRYLSCIIANACVTLDHGKLYYCSLPAYAHLYNERFGDTLENRSDAISIYGNDKEAILNFLRTPHQFCRYCDVKYRDKKGNLISWERSKLEASEWTFDDEAIQN